MNCRVLLRRGIEGHPFPGRADEAQAAGLSSLVTTAIRGTGRFECLNLSRAGSLERRTAVERDLVPQAFAVQGGDRKSTRLKSSHRIRYSMTSFA